MSEPQPLESEVQIPKNESITSREAIEAPVGFISVYHETPRRNIFLIDQQGLRIGTERHMAKDPFVMRVNRLLDDARPREWIEAGVSRNAALYAYPFLDRGHRLQGMADDALNACSIRSKYESHQKHSPQYLEGLGIKSISEYYDYVMDENRKTYGDNVVLDLKVDPVRCYVGDIKIIDYATREKKTDEKLTHDLKSYWENMISLHDCLKWYKRRLDNGNEPDMDLKNPNSYEPDGFSLLKDAPDYLPTVIQQAEILIEDPVPQQYIRQVPFLNYNELEQFAYGNF